MALLCQYCTANISADVSFALPFLLYSTTTAASLLMKWHLSMTKLPCWGPASTEGRRKVDNVTLGLYIATIPPILQHWHLLVCILTDSMSYFCFRQGCWILSLKYVLSNPDRGISMGHFIHWNCVLTVSSEVMFCHFIKKVLKKLQIVWHNSDLESICYKEKQKKLLLIKNYRFLISSFLGLDILSCNMKERSHINMFKFKFNFKLFFYI